MAGNASLTYWSLTASRTTDSTEALCLEDLDAVNVLHRLDARFHDLRSDLREDFADLEVDDIGAEDILGFIDSLFTIGLYFESFVVSLGKYTNLISFSLSLGSHSFGLVVSRLLFSLGGNGQINGLHLSLLLSLNQLNLFIPVGRGGLTNGYNILLLLDHLGTCYCGLPFSQ